MLTTSREVRVQCPCFAIAKGIPQTNEYYALDSGEDLHQKHDRETRRDERRRTKLRGDQELSAGTMMDALAISIGSLTLKNPLIAGAAEHLIEPDGVRSALAAGVGAVVVKSTNESQAAKDQLERAEYVALDERWRPVPWGKDAPASVTIACRSGLSPLPFPEWLEQAALLDREARAQEAYAVASLVLAELGPALEMARQVEMAGLRVLEFNIGTPYASQAAKGAVSTELDPERVRAVVGAMRAAIRIPLWVKLTSQSERVPELARAAFEAGADSVVMAGRLLGLVPDVVSCEPMLGTSLGVGGFWNLPLTCHSLASARAVLGRDKPLIGTNGAQSGLDVARMMLSGASAVEIASSAMLRGFGVLSDALGEFDWYVREKGVRAADLVGRAADRRKSFAQMPSRPGNWRHYVPK